ncbi:uncharacterized protein PAC_17399 [Phialocephala subalpina]|uniref:Uncharacterized protein n=1 Tax=Phialocephala subalpina TaxID=576137 RepID=A0A1L7XR36_9HELO|nr:uncharacterized protein PAC_17399 [Phialocephala subalpina]
MDEQYTPNEKGGTSEDITADPNYQTEKGGTLVSSPAMAVGDNTIPIYSVLESRSHQINVAWLYLGATVAVCAFTVSFAYSALVSNKKVPRYYDFSPTRTLRMLNVASVISILLVKGLVGAVLDVLGWALVSAPGVTSVSTFRAMQETTGTTDLGRMLLMFGKHQKWCIMRLLITALTIVASILLMSEITSSDVYNEDSSFPVLAGLADIHSSVQALEKSNVFGNTSTVQETSINMMILGTTRSILTDPTLAIPITPFQCTGTDCQSIFLPGGLGITRYLNNGSALSDAGVPPAEGAVIIHDAPGYHMEFTSTNYAFNNSTDCINICPFDVMLKADCDSDSTWHTTPATSLVLSLFQRTATVAYDKSNFSILSIEHISTPTVATHPNITADFQRMFSVMYPEVANILNDIAGAIVDPSSIFPELAYWASVYCVQSEVSSANWLYQNGFPTWVTGERDILAGFLAIPIQFGTLLWQWVDWKDMPATLQTQASRATATYRARVKLWTVELFAAIVFGIVLWAFACLVYAHITQFWIKQPQHSPKLNAAFQNGNPFEVPNGGLKDMLRSILGCFCVRPGKAGKAENVEVKSISDGTLVIIKEPGN